MTADARSLEDLRLEYTRQGLAEAELPASPLDLFLRWFEEARAAGLREPNAMTLATVDERGRPTARIVLLKGAAPEGFRFYTNYQSQKGRHLARQPAAALCFFWSELERQVRVEGEVERGSAEDADQYFATRPRESRLGAWASEQSSVLGSREELERRAAEVARRYPEPGPVPRPPHWGGYLLRPRRIEFWQGRPARLHDRLLYQLGSTGRWSSVRLAP
jgi:pyridoxamine 5'-phosphate oxidase